MLKVNTKILLILSCFVFLSTLLFSQTLSKKNQQKLDEYNLEINKNKNNLNYEIDYLNKAAFLCWNNQLNKKALEYFNLSLEKNKKVKNTNGIKSVYYYIGMIQYELSDYDKAILSFSEGIKLSKQLENKNSTISGLTNLAQAYSEIGNYNESILKSEEALNIAKELNNLTFIRKCYGLIAENYQKLGNSTKSIEYFDLFASIDKHIKNQEISNIKTESKNQITKANQDKQKTEKELKSQTYKLEETQDSLSIIEKISKERKMQLEIKDLQIREQDAKLKFERLLRNIFIYGFFIILFFSAILLRLYRNNKKQRIHIEKQRDTLNTQNKKINSSINYAQNIQQAILPKSSTISDVFNMFIIYRPKDIVSGDFYWFNKVNNRTIVAVIDCTGHGVSGAFMSMIGNSILNEIILEKKITDPAQILTLLNKEIIKALKQTETENTDGMDVCIISAKKQDTNYNILFSGAKRPLYKYNSSGNSIEIIKGDRLTIGGKNINNNEKIFTNHKIAIKKDDILFLSSDGIIDQNNNSRKRFGSKKLINILEENINEPMGEIKNILETELDNFQKDEEQRDDITFLGIKAI